MRNLCFEIWGGKTIILGGTKNGIWRDRTMDLAGQCLSLEPETIAPGRKKGYKIGLNINPTVYPQVIWLRLWFEQWDFGLPGAVWCVWGKLDDRNHRRISMLYEKALFSYTWLRLRLIRPCLSFYLSLLSKVYSLDSTIQTCSQIQSAATVSSFNIIH